MENQIEIYRSDDGQAQIEVRFTEDTIWLSQKQMADLFGKDSDTIGLHLKNIFNEGELEEKATTEESSVVQQEGKRHVRRKINFYNLDAIISVGYRVNSKRGTQFRQWATQKLKDYLVQGYAINEKRLTQKREEVRHLKNGIRILSRALEDKATDSDYQWLNQYTHGLHLLDDYDNETLDSSGDTLAPVTYPSYQDYMEIIEQMRSGFNSSLFGQERGDGFKSAIDQIRQSAGKKDLYPSFEEKAATLLYLIVKNHAFIDGNKRIAAACFLLFLQRNNRLTSSEGILVISDEALTSLTLFVAVSKSDEMETVKRLIISILNRAFASHSL